MASSGERLRLVAVDRDGRGLGQKKGGEKDPSVKEKRNVINYHGIVEQKREGC